MSRFDWTQNAKSTVTPVKHLLAKLSLIVRGGQFKVFLGRFRPNLQTTVLDVGSTSDETLKDSNLFLRLYPFKNKLTTATIENSTKLKRLYPEINVKKISPNKPLPFRNKSFDIAVSWATIEHVGNYQQQRFFISELLRVAKGIFLTTPYRGCPYEPHTGFWFLHWLPLNWFRWLCRQTGQNFLAQEANLNPLYARDVRAMIPQKIKVEIKVYKMFGLLPSHLLIYTKRK